MKDGSYLITCVHGKSKQKVQFMVLESLLITLCLLVLPRQVFEFIFGLGLYEIPIQKNKLKAFYRIRVIVYVSGKDKVGILLISFNAVMKIIATIQSDHMNLPSNTLIGSVQDGQRPLIPLQMVKPLHAQL